MLKNIKLHHFSSFVVSLIIISVFLVSSFASTTRAWYNSGGSGLPGAGTDIDETITDFTVDFDPSDNNATVDVLQEDAEAEVYIYYSTTEEINAVIDVIQDEDDGEIQLYIGVCSDSDCTPHDPKRMVVKIQQEGNDDVLVEWIEIDDDGNETTVNQYVDDTTDLSDEELAWLSEVLVAPATPSPSPSASPSPSPTPTVSPSPSPSASPVAPTDSSSSDDNSSSSSPSNSSSSNNTTPASPPVCSAQTPSAVSNLQISDQGANSVTLSWNAASPATHYALIFTRTSDGEQYGAADIGNTTSYTIQGISGQAAYTFEVFAVNSCQPGDRASTSSPSFTGPVLAARPVGDGGQVLGTTTESRLENDFAQNTIKEEETVKPSPSPSASPVASAVPAVLGLTDGICTEGGTFLPLILLAIQMAVIAGLEYYFRTDRTNLRCYLAGGVSILSIIAFYLFAKCNCAAGSWQDLLCFWYWLVALVLGVAGRVVGMQLTKPTKKSKSK